jgi:exportin-7
MDAAQQATLVQQFEALCTAVYEPDESLPSDQMALSVQQTQTKIMKIIQNDSFWQLVQIILTKTSNNYAITIAANAYRDFMTQRWNRFSQEDRVKVRNFVLRVMREKMGILNHASRMALISLVTRVTKLGWFDDERHKALVEDALKLLVADHPQSYCLGIDLLAQLVEDMNKPLRDESLTDHRKIAVSFRETSLKEVFRAALSCIRDVSNHPDSPSKVNMCNVGVNLAVQCLKYDFIGTNPDESMLEMSNIHVPTTWRHIMQDPNVIPILFQVYKASRCVLLTRAQYACFRACCVLMPAHSFLTVVRPSLTANQLVVHTTFTMI